MNLEPYVEFCRALPHVVEDIKWGNDLVFSIDSGRMFCVFSFEDEQWRGMSFKVDEHRFLEMTDRRQFDPAPYMARARWVKLNSLEGLRVDELESLVRRSYQLYFEKLPKKTQKAFMQT